MVLTKIKSEGTNSDSLPPSRQGDSTNMSSSNDKGQVTVVVAKVRYEAAKNQAHRRSEQPSWHCSSDQILRVLLDSGSDGDLMFHEKGMIMHFPYLTRQVPISWHMSNESFVTTGRTEIIIRFFTYLNIKEYTVSPDLVEYDRKKMTKPFAPYFLYLR